MKIMVLMNPKLPEDERGKAKVRKKMSRRPSRVEKVVSLKF